jgi:small subunit ribosomal protein S16
VKIRLKRLGKIRAPYYRIVVVDARAKRDGRVIEEIGKYHPTENPSYIEVNSERVQYWLSVGAQPTDPVLAQLKLTGDWQKFKGLPYNEGRLKLPARHAAAAAAAAAVEAAEAEALKKVAAQAEAKAKAKAKAAEAKAQAGAEAATPAPAEAPAEDVAGSPIDAAAAPAEAAAEA